LWPVTGGPRSWPARPGDFRPLTASTLMGRPLIGRELMGRPLIGRELMGRPLIGREPNDSRWA
jgi:hypothetical protein